MCIGAVVYWAFGFGLTFGTDQGRFIGTTYFFFHEMAGKVWLNFKKHSRKFLNFFTKTYNLRDSDFALF